MQSIIEQFTDAESEKPIAVSPFQTAAVWQIDDSRCLVEYGMNLRTEVQGKAEDVIKALDFPHLKVTDAETGSQGWVSLLYLAAIRSYDDDQSVLFYGHGFEQAVSEKITDLVKQGKDTPTPFGDFLSTLTVDKERVQRSTPATA